VGVQVGKSTALAMLTGTESEAAAYEFTTLTCIPVMRSSSEEGSYLRLVALLYYSTLGIE